jgi:putative FmdB family regulatory protein
MPIYEYVCQACERRFEKYVRAFGEDVTCPACGAPRVEKLLSTFAMAGARDPRPAAGGCCGGGCGCAR